MSKWSTMASTERATSEAWAVVILDVMMPGCDGFEVLRRIRAKSKVPVMMLTGRGEEVDRIVGLELGADDYLPKTFSSRELLARLRALLRRTGWVSETAPHAPLKEIIVGELRINPEAHAVVLGDEALQLTPAEFGLLLSLARAQFKLGLDWLLSGEPGDRIAAIGDGLTQELSRIPEEEWPARLDAYDRTHGVTFALFANTGEQLFGARMDVPAEVMPGSSTDATMPNVR
jgi:hypothetical protein